MARESIEAAVEGRVAAGFEPVAEEFARLFSEEGELGAAFAAVVDGEPVVDLWGGLTDADQGAPWQEETVQLVFSGAKGIVATCLLLLLERGALDLDKPVCSYWPEFGEAGKESVLVRHVVSHTAGLPGLRDGFTRNEVLQPELMSARLAAEATFWPPGSRLAYHALTWGWLCGELVRRITGRSIGRFLADELAAPLGLELWIGLPEEHEPRVATLHRASSYGVAYRGEEPEPLLESVYGDLMSSGFAWNDPAFHQAEIPAANAIGTARSIARLYGLLARGGEVDGLWLLSPEVVELGRTELAQGTCAVTLRPYAFAAGFELSADGGTWLGGPANAFGHTGSGGSSHGAWPDQRVGFSYATNELRAEAGDNRARRLLAALAESLSGHR